MQETDKLYDNVDGPKKKKEVYVPQGPRELA